MPDQLQPKKKLKGKSNWATLYFVFFGAFAAQIFANYENFIIAYSINKIKYDQEVSNVTKPRLHQILLEHNIFVPMEDIFLSSELQEKSVLFKTCGGGRIFFWVPFPLRIPILGTKIIERCVSL